MSSDPELPQYQLSELLTLVNAELWSVITAMGKQPVTDANLQVDSVKVRLGQVPLDEPSADDGDFLDISRYGADGKSWLLSLDYRFDDKRTALTSANQNVTIPVAQWRSSAIFFAPFSVRVIKGVSAVWAEKLRSIGISTVEQLSDMTDETLSNAMAKFSSSLPLELRTKARLTGNEIPPIPPSEADSFSLHTLALFKFDELKKVLSQNMPVLDVRSFSSFLSVVFTVIDQDTLKEISLRAFRESIDKA